MVGFFYRVPVYLSPLFMSGMEIQLNQLAKSNAPSAVLAPSMAAAAIGLFLPALKPSPTAPGGWKKKTDGVACALAVLGLLVGFYLWEMLVAANLGGDMPGWLPGWNWFGLGRQPTLAILVYGVAAFLAEVKAQVES